MGVNFTKSGIAVASGDIVNPNILTNSDFSSRYQQTTGWDTTKNGTLLATGWYGYNSGVANQATCYHAHLTWFQGEYVYVFIRDTETWLGINKNSLQSYISKNTTYTWSLEEYRVSGSNNYINAGLYYYNNAGTRGFHSGNVRGNGDDGFDKWNKKYYTFTIGEDIQLTKEVVFYIYGYNGGSGTVYVRHPKLEASSTPTPWVKAASEGYTTTNHGFVETGDKMSVYDGHIETSEIIEY